METAGFYMLDICDESKGVEEIFPPQKLWEKSTVSEPNSAFQGIFQEISELIGEERIRVKVLDGEDIRSLGFEGSCSETGWGTFEKDGDKILVAPSKDEYPWPSLTIFPASLKKGTLVRWRGKNISELRRLLRQAGILT